MFLLVMRIYFENDGVYKNLTFKLFFLDFVYMLNSYDIIIATILTNPKGFIV